MLYYEEMKQAVDAGYIIGDTVQIVRRKGKIVDYVLLGEKISPGEVVTFEKVSSVLLELEKEESKKD